MNTVSILLSAFVLSVVALLFFIWTQRRGLLDDNPEGARVIFGADEEGRVEDPAAGVRDAAALQQVTDAARGQTVRPASDSELAQRAAADASTAPVVFFFLCCAFAWLLVASAAGLTASLKLHLPDWLTQCIGTVLGSVLPFTPEAFFRLSHANPIRSG